WKVPSPLPSNTETVLDPALATARSSLPSPLKSRTATETGFVPTEKARAVRKVPSPLPSRTETVLSGLVAIARSCTRSPLKSPTATNTGVAPDSKSRWATNDTVWAAAGFGNPHDKRQAAATSSDRRAEILVMSSSSLKTETLFRLLLGKSVSHTR